MKIRYPKTTIAAVLSLVLIGGAVAVAKQGHWHDPERFAGKMVERATDKLDLDADQVAHLTVLKDKALAVRSRVRRLHGESREDLIGLLDAPTLDQGRVTDTVDQYTAEFELIVAELLPDIARFTDSLTPDQRAELRDMIGDRWAHRWTARSED